MPKTLVFTFAVAPTCAGMAEAPLLRILARQLPRVIVAALNGKADRGVRFFPFLGMQDGKRRFFELETMLPAEHLLAVHAQKGVAALVDGCIERAGLHLRVLDAQSGDELWGESVPFQAEDAYAAVRRAAFELGGVLGIRSEPPQGPALFGRAMECLWIARDDLLGIEANLVRADARAAFAAIAEAMQLAPQEPEVRALCLTIATRLLATGEAKETITACLGRALASVAQVDAAFLEAAWPLARACDPELGLAYAEALARANPGATDAVLQCAQALVARNDVARARAILANALAQGPLDGSLLAEAARLATLCGDAKGAAELFARLAVAPSPPGDATLVLAEHLVRSDQLVEAAAHLERALQAEPRHTGLLLGASRIALLRGEVEAAAAFLARCDRGVLRPSERADLDRLTSFVQMPDALAALRIVERSLAECDLAAALAAARGLTRARRDFAEGWLVLGIVRARLGHRWRAARAFRSALRRDATLGEAWHRLGMLLLASGKAARSLEPLQRAVELLPEESAPRVHLAQACSQLGDDAQGRRELEAAARLGASEELVAEVRKLFPALGS